MKRRLLAISICFCLAQLGLAQSARAQQQDITKCSQPCAPDSPEAVVRAYAQMLFFEKKIKEAFERYVAEDQLQHNPNIGDGRQASIDYLTSRGGTSWISDVKAIIAQGELVALFQHVRKGPEDTRGVAVVDIWRVKNGKIVEHWDVAQPVPENPIGPMF